MKKSGNTDRVFKSDKSSHLKLLAELSINFRNFGLRFTGYSVNFVKADYFNDHQFTLIIDDLDS